MSVRNTVMFDEIGAHRTTYLGSASLAFDRTVANGTLHKDKAVTVLANKQVGLAAAGNRVTGAVDHVEVDGMVVVVDSGYIRFLGTGTLGLGVIGAAGGLVAAATGQDAGFGVVVESGTGYVIVEHI